MTEFRRHLKKRHRLNRFSGAASVELALLLPVLVLLAAAATDFGRIAHHYILLSNATRCGAEYGSRHGFTSLTKPDWEEQVRQAVHQEVDGNSSLDVNEFEIAISTTTDSDDLSRIGVEVSLPFRTAVAWPWLPNIVELSHRVEMRQIR